MLSATVSEKAVENAVSEKILEPVQEMAAEKADAGKKTAAEEETADTEQMWSSCGAAGL